MPGVLRIIDANANRAREAMRVMEEAARFILSDVTLCAKLKTLRHDFAQALGTVKGLEAWRDTPDDVGTAITTATESLRTAPADVVIAAGKRLSEALRTIEEYAKTLGKPGPGESEIATAIEALRYRAYDIEKQLNLAMGATARRQWRLCVLLTESLCTHLHWKDVLNAAIDGGADCIQLRQKQMDSARLLERARSIVSICHKRHVSVIVNDRPDIALLSEADGVHLGQTDLPCSQVRKLVGRQLLIGISTSSIDQAQNALAHGADYCGVGPMFPTTTKEKKTIVGPAYLHQYLAWGRLAHLAIGGIDPNNIRQLAAAGALGVAVSRAVCSAENPATAATQLLASLGQEINPQRAGL